MPVISAKSTILPVLPVSPVSSLTASGLPGSGTNTIPTGTTPQNAVSRSYLLRVAIQNRHLNFFYASSPSLPDSSEDPPLSMRVSDPANRIELILDDNQIDGLDWYFAQDNDTIILGKSDVSKPETRYVNLQFDNTSPKCKRLWFYATRLDIPDGAGGKVPNTDAITIRVVLEQDIGGVTQTDPLYLYIDPGIKNPGDDD